MIEERKEYMVQVLWESVGKDLGTASHRDTAKVTFKYCLVSALSTDTQYSV